MQISSNIVGFNFRSVYESVVTRRDASLAEQVSARAAADQTAAEDDNLALTEVTHRESQMLQAAQRVAERTADQLAHAPEL